MENPLIIEGNDPFSLTLPKDCSPRILCSGITVLVEKHRGDIFLPVPGGFLRLESDQLERLDRYGADYVNLQSAQGSGCPLLKGTIGYLENFLGKPHEKLAEKGHHGTVCPFTPRVLKNGTVYFARETVNPSDTDVEAKIKEFLVNRHLPNFFDIVEAQVAQDQKRLACLLIVIHGLNSAENCQRFVSNTQKKLQPDFVKAGLLLSELHPHNLVPSVRNPELLASRPPFPIFFIRRIIPNDIPYLLRKDRYNDETYGKILFRLHLDFGPDVINQEMKRLGKEADFSLLPRCRLLGMKCDCKEDFVHNEFGMMLWDKMAIHCSMTEKIHCI